MADPDDSVKNDIIAHYDAIAADYGKRYGPGALSGAGKYPANYIRLRNLVERLAGQKAKRIYEVGTGEGTPLATLAQMGFEVAGCDISKTMVEATRAKLAAIGLDPELCQLGDIEHRTSIKNQIANGPYDAVIAFGVLPHVRDDVLALQNMRLLLHGGGKAFVEFRNKVFALFTFNRKTKEFILDDLLADVSAPVRKAVAKELDGRLALELPVARSSVADGKPGYDAILSRFHNPFEIPALFEAAGFANPRIHWYHYHPAPPMVEGALGDAFREEAMKLEGETSGWRGYFLCSAGVVEADAED